MLLRFLDVTKASLLWQQSILGLLLLAALIFQGVTDRSVLLISYGVFLLLSPIYFFRLQKQISITFTPLSLLLILWLIWVYLPYYFGWVANTSLFGFFQCSPWIVTFFILETSNSTKRLWSGLFQIVWLLSLICALYALFQFFILHQMPCGFFASKNTTAAFLMMTLLILTGEFLKPTLRPLKVANSVYLALIGISIVILALAMFSALSRGVMISFSCGLAVELIVLGHVISKKRLFLFLTLLFLAFSLFLLIAQPAIAHRLLLLQREKSRLIMWQGAWHLWQNTPWYGLGIFNFKHYYQAYSLPGDGSVLEYAHNDFLQLLIETGIPGGMILLSIMVIISLSLWRYLQQHFKGEHVPLVACFAALMSFVFHSVVDFNFYVLPMNLLLGCYLGYLHNGLKEAGAIPSWPIRLSILQQRLLILLGLLLGLFISSNALRLLMFDYHTTKADIATKQHHYQAALPHTKQALQWLDVAALHSHRADLYLQFANSAKTRDEKQTFTRKTQNEINKALANNPYYARPYFQMALVQSILLNNPAKAQNFFAESIAKNPHYSLARLTFCQFLIEQQDLIYAQRVLEQGLHYPIAPEQAEIYLNYLAKLRYENGDKKGALQIASRLQHLSYYNYDYSDLISASV
ncbi:O-antigen ligase family protein [Legionella jamestowniensis]|uniref:O-Antigen ligase n=1 Tax=Legionella jamestowniensis TaxID=455 RepID=A0A0W0UG32_9GAMM|nr:O-antigen ligase family protein [Legionella jamestowniensis]KTD06837.1 O-Antigen ligase [Legionella jamestowniensis]SFL82471.1 O-antigen ligase [Legionella jamestowniensis DSM 19215]